MRLPAPTGNISHGGTEEAEGSLIPMLLKSNPGRIAE